MFKLLKDLAREPSPLAGQTGQAGQAAAQSSGDGPAAPVNSSRLSTPAAPSPTPSGDSQPSLPPVAAEEDDPEALQVVGLVHALQCDEGLMQYVEVSLQWPNRLSLFC